MKLKDVLKKNMAEEPARRASPEFSRISTEFREAMENLGDHAKLSQTLKNANQMISKLSVPFEKQQVGNMIGALTGAVDASTQGGGSPLQMRKPAASPARKF